jgi:hypothetical protein
MISTASGELEAAAKVTMNCTYFGRLNAYNQNSLPLSVLPGGIKRKLFDFRKRTMMEL